MKLELPNESCITDIALNILKQQIIYLIPKYEEKYPKISQIFLYENHLKIIANGKCYLVTLINLNDDIFWYIKPFNNSYILIKNNKNMDIKKILDLILKINS